MTIAEAAEGGGSAIFDLIAPFSESADARLRGNAVQALAALLGSQDKSLHEQAMDEIVRVMSSAPGGSGALDWQQRFGARCLDALARLQPAERRLVGQQILATSFSAREPERRAAIARLSLAAMDHDRRFWSAGWIRWLRLVRFAARSGFWLISWAVLWRTAVVWLIFGSGAAIVIGAWLNSEKMFSDDLIQQAGAIGGVTAITLTISALLSVSGSIRPPLRICIADIAVSALMLTLITIWGVAVELSDVPFRISDWNKLSLCVLGFVLGAAIRALRWVAIAVETEPSGTGGGFRPLAALGVTTLVCIAADRLGMDMRAAAIGWMVLTPATMTAAWLDVWLENSEPHPPTRGQARADGRWVVPVLAGSAILISAWLVGLNLKNALDWSAAQVEEKVQLPGTSDSNGASTEIAGFGHRVPLAEADVDGSYQIVVRTNPGERMTLFLIQDTPDQNAPHVTKSSGDQLHPPTITVKLQKNRVYLVCLMPETRESCSSPSSVAKLSDFDILVINGGDGDIHATHTISISRSQ
jgi:hypothetical protein